MRRSLALIAVFTVTLSLNPVAAQEPTTLTNRRSVEFTGTVYDIDYGSQRTQILIRPTGAPDGLNLVGFVKSEAIQEVLQTSLVASRTIQVTHYDQNIIRAVLIQTPSTCSAEGCVSEVDCSDFDCTAVVVGHVGRVSTRDQRALGILLTSINDGRRVEELIVDQNQNIIRVKVNVPSAQRP